MNKHTFIIVQNQNRHYYLEDSVQHYSNYFLHSYIVRTMLRWNLDIHVHVDILHNYT